MSVPVLAALTVPAEIPLFCDAIRISPSYMDYASELCEDFLSDSWLYSGTSKTLWKHFRFLKYTTDYRKGLDT
jgi:hypothetical protein